MKYQFLSIIFDNTKGDNIRKEISKILNDTTFHFSEGNPDINYIGFDPATGEDEIIGFICIFYFINTFDIIHKQLDRRMV